MRKKLYLFLLVVLMLTPFCVKGLDDEEAPTLSKVSLSSYSLTPGENVTIYVEGNDNLTGIANIDVEVRLKTNNSNYFTLASAVTPANSFSYTKTVPENVTPGEYEIFAIQVWDAASNLRTYYIGSDGWPVSNNDVTVNDSGKDFTAPTLSNFRITPQSTTYPNNFTINVDAIDDRSGVKQVTFIYEINGKMYNYTLNKSSGNTYSIKATVDENAIYSDAKFVTAYVYDEAGNSSKYDTDVSRDPYRNYKEIILSQNLDVTFTNKVIDNELPKLNSCSYSSDKVAAPGTLTISCNITDDTGIGDVKIYFQGYDENNKLIDSIVFFATYNSNKKIATAKHTFSQYTANSTFYIDKVEITDSSGKVATYTIYNDDNLNMEKKTLTLVQAVSSDKTVSTVNNSYLDEIKNLEEGKSVTVDTTSTSILKAEAFDAIKGKNVDMIVVNDGIQWVFNGKNIINDSKDINTKIKVYKINEYGDQDYSGMFDENTDAIVIEFANNGLLPGKVLIKIKADYALRDYIGDTNLYVYHVEKSEDGLESIAKQISLSDDGYYEFYITHNSKYIISKKSANRSSIVKDSIEELGNTELIDEEILEDYEANENIDIKETNAKKNSNKTLIMCISIPLVIVVLIVLILLIFKKKKIIEKKSEKKGTKKKDTKKKNNNIKK